MTRRFLACALWFPLACGGGDSETGPSLGTTLTGASDSETGGDAGTGGTGGTGGPSPSETAQTICELIWTCSCDQSMTATQAECTTYLEETLQLAIDEARAYGLTHDGTCEAQSLQQYVDLGCDASFPDGEPGACQPPCKKFHGQVGVSGTCTYVGAVGADNCAQGLVCTDGVCVNPCDAVPPPAVGEYCYGGECEPGAWCSYTDPSFPVCEALPGVGAECTSFGECLDDLYCDFSVGINGTCTAYPGLGEPCPSFQCAEGLMCDGISCVALPGEGESCPSGQCGADLYCDFNSICQLDPALVCGLWQP